MVKQDAWVPKHYTVIVWKKKKVYYWRKNLGKPLYFLSFMQHVLLVDDSIMEIKIRIILTVDSYGM